MSTYRRGMARLALDHKAGAADREMALKYNRNFAAAAFQLKDLGK